ncbi:MAG: hypothetical protein E6G68_05700 [Actinobacteria bacterium]|nr:MAG: hypothetical protein E6G68_05700 [Actinomycetota bacterium]
MKPRTRTRSAALALGIVTTVGVLAAGALPGRAAGGPDSSTQPLLDGCQRSDSLELATSTPEWTYVDANDVRTARLSGDETAGRRTIVGTVVESRPSGEDLYITHDFNDYNILVRPDRGYEGLLATGNLAPGDEHNLLEGEWEVTAIPLWAWASAGDRVRVSGSWAWDCGHWGNSAADPTGLSQLLVYDPVETLQDVAQPGTIRGETTELHPMYEIAVVRAHAAGRLLGYGAHQLSWLDVWINGDGTPAHSIEECALRGITVAAVARVACPRARDVGGTYSYTFKLRPRPSKTSRLIVNPPFLHPETVPELRSIPVSIVPNVRRGTVTVRFTLPHGTTPQRYGITVTAGWSDDAPAVQRVVRLDRIHIVRSLDGASEPNLNPAGVPAEYTPDPGEWVLYANVSGHWVQIPGIAQVRDGQNVPIGATLRFFSPRGIAPTLFVSGHECDEPLMDCPHEGTSQTPQLLSVVELGFNDRPGRIQRDGFGLPMRPGAALYHPPANPDPHSGNEDLSDAICGPVGCYLLTATWVR